MRHGAVAIETISLAIRLPIRYHGNGLGVTADAILLYDRPCGLVGAQRIGNIAQGEMDHIIESGLHLDVVLGDEGMRGVTLRTNRPFAMRPFQPTLVLHVHHMAGVAGSRITGQINWEIHQVQGEPDHPNQQSSSDNERNLQVFHE